MILEGFKVTFVLRKEIEDWKIVGDCYVHGIMDGELVVSTKDTEVGPDEVSKDGNGQSFACSRPWDLPNSKNSALSEKNPAAWESQKYIAVFV